MIPLEQPNLLPQPRVVRLQSERIPIRGRALRVDVTAGEFSAASRALSRLPSDAGGSPLTVKLERADLPSQAYRLQLAASGIVIEAGDDAGAFYAAQTLRQLWTAYSSGDLPTGLIEDSPDFAVRGVMLDVSRDKVPTLQTLLDLVDLLAGWKINQIQLYIEHTFAYSNHRTVWANASPLTPEDVRTLDARCREHCLDLVPNQNSFGHMERWLTHPEYAPLAETLDSSDTGWGFRWKGPFSLCPIDPACERLLAGLYDELLPNFSSKLFNVGADETFDVGQGRSSDEVARIGKRAVYLDFLRRLQKLVQDRGRTMLYWGDIVLQGDVPAEDLPRNAIALQWGYEAEHPFETGAARFAAAGVPFYVCPGTSSWNSLLGKTENAFANIRNAAAAGLAHGALGLLMTDWGDNGHLQYMPVSLPSMAYAAAVSWCGETNADRPVDAAVDRDCFDGTPLTQSLLQLGNVYRASNTPAPNATALFRALVPPPEGMRSAVPTSEDLDASEKALDVAEQTLPKNAAGRAKLAVDEMRNAAEMLRLAAAVVRRKLGGPAGQDQARWNTVVANHRTLWLARNRPGGLDDSAGRLVAAIART